MITAYQTFFERNLSDLIFPYLSEDRENLGQVSKGWQLAKEKFESRCGKTFSLMIYNRGMIEFIEKDIAWEIKKGRPVDEDQEILAKMQQEERSLFVRDGSGIQEQRMVKILGEGGSKVAIQMSSGKALIACNSPMSVMWKRMVSEEVGMSRFLTSLGMLSPLSERVTISFSANSNEEIPAYVSQTFENFRETHNCFIIDVKNKESCTWVSGRDFLFKSDEERFVEENWDSAVNSLMDDIAKLVLFKVPCDSDFMNIAIILKPSESTLCQYEIRFFGFDYSSKIESRPVPKLPAQAPNMESVESLLNNILATIFYREFSNSPAYPGDLKERLVARYSKEIVIRLGQYIG